MCLDVALERWQTLLQNFVQRSDMIERKCFLCGSHCTAIYILVFQYIYLYYMHVLRSEFGHVYLVTTLVYLLNLLYVNYWWFGGHRAQHLFVLSIVCVYTVSASLCTARCVLGLARDHAPKKCPLLLLLLLLLLYA